jgi:hypothetical protein
LRIAPNNSLSEKNVTAAKQVAGKSQRQLCKVRVNYLCSSAQKLETLTEIAIVTTMLVSVRLAFVFETGRL